MTSLPRGWRNGTLAALGAEAQTGFASGANNRSGIGIIHLRPMNVTRNGTVDLMDVKYVEDVTDRRVRTGDVLFNNTNSPALVGKTAIVEVAEPLAYSNHMTRLRFPAEAVDPKFMAHQLHHLWMAGFFESICSNHVNQASVSAKRLLAVDVVLPPLDEQRRIVAILEDNLSRLDAGLRSTASVRRLTPLLLRQALTARIDNVVADRRPLGELVREGMRNGHSARASLDGTGIRTLTLTAVTKGEFTDANSKLTVADKDKVQDLWLEPGDIFVERANTPELVGTSALYRGLTGWAIFPDLLIRVRADTSVVSPEYIGLVLQSPESRQFLRDRAKGLAGSMPKIDQGTLAQLPVPVPSLVEQTQVVGFMESLIEKCKRIDGLATTVEVHGNLLRKSLMIAAFSGQLTKESVSV